MGDAGFYACAFPSMVTRWREHFKSPQLWFGFVQIAGWQYGHAWGSSAQAGDLRQAQLSAIALGNVGSVQPERPTLKSKTVQLF